MSNFARKRSGARRRANAGRSNRRRHLRAKLHYRALRGEQLESRDLLASITGHVFYDVNSDGVLDAFDRPQAGWQVFLDDNANGQYDDGERSTISDSQGFYAFTGLTTGQFNVAAIPATGWTPVVPPAGMTTVTLGESDQTTVNFGNVLSGLIHHWTFDETSGDIAADAIGGNPAILVNWDANELSWQPGFVNGALKFSDSDDYAISSNPIDSLDEFTVAFWSKLDQRINNDQIILTPQGQNWVSKNSGGVGIGDVHDPREPLKQIWEHYVIAMNRLTGFATVYRDGRAVASGTTALAQLNQKWVFGHNQDPANDSSSWHGLLDDVRLFNRMLGPSEAEILAYRPPQPGILSVLVAESKDFGSQPVGKYESTTITLNIDPATVDWLAWNRFPDLRAMELSRGQELLLGSHTPEIDDSFLLTIRNPLGQVLSVELDGNGELGAPIGPQAVIYGTASQTPDVLRGDNFQNPNLFDEVGTHHSLFTVAGDYEFTFEFNSIGGLAGYPDVWLVMRKSSCIDGTSWHDLDSDGDRESGEPGIQSRQVYVDRNDNGQFDDGEPNSFTNADGTFRIDSISSGRHIVRQVATDGWISTPPGDPTRHIVDVLASECATNVDFGGKRNAIPVTPGNLLVTKGSVTETDLLIEYTVEGEPIQAIAIPDSSEATDKIAKDVVVDNLFALRLLSSSGPSSLVTYDSANSAFTETVVPGWTINQSANHFGDIAAFEDYLFAIDHGTGGENAGVLRFHTSDLTSVRFALGELDDLTVGRDGFLYVMASDATSSIIRGYYPRSMHLARSIRLPERFHSISVNENGDLYGLSDSALKKMNSRGAVVASTDVVGRSVDFSPDGRTLLVTSSELGTLISADFSSKKSFELPNPTSGYAFGAFIQTPIIRNFPPEASNEAYSVDEDTTLAITAPGLLMNDFDEESEPMTVKREVATRHGSITVNADGSFEYQPHADFVGEDSFTYRSRAGSAESNLATVSISVKPIQDAPRLTPGGPTRTTNEDTPLVLSLTDFINTDASGDVVITDPDGGDAVGGIALTSLQGPGIWEYSLDGSSFTVMTALNSSLGLLLPAAAQLRFTPDGLNGGTAQITFRAWDAKIGIAGEFAEIASTGGTSAFSTGVETMTVQVDSVNDAPLLEPLRPELGPTDEDTSFDISVRDFLTTVTDVDVNAVASGIALISIDGRGSWMYSLDGNRFLEAGQLSESEALLLEPDDMLRYIPDGINGEVARIVYRAWDRSSGSAGTKTLASDSAANPISPFSANRDSATLDVLSVNDAPTNISIDSTTVIENSGVAVIGRVDVVDRDHGDSHVFSVDDGRFEIAGEEIRLKSGQGIDFETEPSIVIAVTARDSGGLESAETFTLSVTNVNEAPTQLSLSANHIEENDAGANVGELSVIDPDAGDSHELAVNDNRFVIEGLVLKLKPGASVDFESEQAIQLEITATDQKGLKTTSSFAILVRDGNDPPNSISLSGNSVLENASGIKIGIVTASDVDSNQSHTFFTSDARFELVGNELRLKSSQSLDFEVNSVITLDISARDQSGAEVTDSFTIHVVNVNEPPTNLSLSNHTIVENDLEGVIGVITATDTDFADTHTFTLSDSRLEIVDGILKLKPGIALDFETAPSIDFELSARDQGGLEITRQFTVLVQNANERPTNITLSNLTISENGPGAVIGMLSVADVDVGDSHSFVTSDLRFDVADQQLKLHSLISVDFESEPTIPLEILVRDEQGLEFTESFTIVVTNVNESPGILVLSEERVPENAPGAVIGLLSLSDPDVADTHTFAVTDERFEVVDRSLKLRDGVFLDFESNATVAFVITASDSGSPTLRTSKDTVITVENVNDPPTVIDLSSHTVQGNVTGAVVGTVVVSDQDAEQGHVFTLSDTRFEIVNATLRLKPGAYLAGDETSTVNLEITAVDSGTPQQSLRQTFAIQVRANTLPWHNEALKYDTDADGRTVPLDALRVINLLNNPVTLGVGGLLPEAKVEGAFYYDVNGDGFCTPIDVLQIINFVNRESAEAESSAVSTELRFDAILLARQDVTSSQYLRAGLATPALPTSATTTEPGLLRTGLLERFVSSISPERRVNNRFDESNARESMRVLESLEAILSEIYDEPLDE